MLNRITGGIHGLMTYLIDGLKRGRLFTRDEADERVVLAGSHELVDRLIESLDATKERYLHITLAFLEDHLDLATLREIVREFIEFAFAAYSEDEFAYYAEAHLPRLRSYTNAATGRFVERRPHIHIAIPKINLVSGGTLNPFGMVLQHQDFIDAWQEHINSKYGLASPKDHRRTRFIEDTEILEQMDAAPLTSRGDDLKHRILTALIEQEIQSVDAFHTLLKSFGAVRICSAGRPNEYITIKPRGGRQSITLRDDVFSAAFISLPVVEKRAHLIRQCAAECAGSDHEKLTAALDHWKSSRLQSVGQRKALKSQILAAVLDRQVETVDAFRELLKQFGEMRTRNAGRPNEYEHVKPPGSAKGINMRDYVFSREFIELPTEEKRTRLCEDATIEYCSAGPRGDTPAALLETLAEWRSLRAREIKHINSGNRRLYLAYKHGTREEKLRILEEREQRFAQRYRSTVPAIDLRQCFTPDTENTDEDGNDRYLQPGPATTASHQAPPTLGHLPRLSGGHLVCDTDRSHLLLPGDALHQLVHPRAQRDHELRRPHSCPEAVQQTINPATGRSTDSLIGQLHRDLREEITAANHEKTPDLSAIKARLDLRQLLVALSKSHGVMLEKYSIAKAKSGEDRIRCGTRNLNASDFLTKELHLPWVQAEQILREQYAHQRTNTCPPKPHQEPQMDLWQCFKTATANRRTAEHKAAWARQRQAEQERRQAIRDAFEERQALLQRPHASSASKRKANLSLSRIRKIEEERQLRTSIAAERNTLSELYRKPPLEQYRDWLVGRALSDERALAELRRITVDIRRDESASPVIYGTPKDSAANPTYHAPGLTHRVDTNGDVTYLRDGVEILRDTSHKVYVLETSDDTIVMALRLAILKFGTTLSVTGDQQFQHRVAELAADQGLNIRFDNDALNMIMEERLAAVHAERKGARYLEVKPPNTSDRGNSPSEQPLGSAPKQGEASQHHTGNEEQTPIVENPDAQTIGLPQRPEDPISDDDGENRTLKFRR